MFNLKKFATETTIHGCKEFYHTKSMICKIFWIFVLTGAAGLTVFHIYKSVQNYMHQPTVITFETVKRNEMVYPNLMICYPHWIYWISWKKVSKLGFTKESTLYGLSRLSEIYSTLIFNVTRAKCRFEKQMAKNNFTTFSQFYKNIAHTNPPRTFHLRTSFSEISGKFLTEGDAKFCYVLSGEKFINKNITDIFGLGLLFTVSHSTFSSYNEYVNIDEYEKYLRSELFSSESSLLKPKGSINFSEYQIPLELQTSENTHDSIIISPDVEKYIVKMTANVRKWQNKAEKPCIEGKVQKGFFDYECPLKCMANFIHSQCNQYCMHFKDALLINNDHLNTVCPKKITFLNNLNSTEYETIVSSDLDTVGEFDKKNCAEVNDVSCSSKRLRSNKRAECDTCIQSCEQWDFERSVTINVQPRSVREIAVQTFTYIQIFYPREIDIIVMSEVDTFTWDRFIADIGGVLGIWLGASMLSFVQMVYQCCFCETKEERVKGDRKICENNNKDEPV